MEFKVGEWYEQWNSVHNCPELPRTLDRMRCIAVDVTELDGNVAFVTQSGDLCWLESDENIKHLPGCDGWDWKPVEYPLWWRAGDKCIVEQHSVDSVTYHELRFGKIDSTRHDRWPGLYDGAKLGYSLMSRDEAQAWLRRGKPKWTPPEPGEGWRLLGVGERAEHGDDFWNSTAGNWETSFGGYRIEETDLIDPADRRSYWVRRRVAPVKQTVPTGWTQVGGVAGGMLWFAPDDSEPAAEVAPISAQVENTAETELWRELEVGETVREGDEERCEGKWIASTVKNSPMRSYYCPVRRRVRVESPGWRYLDEGETVVTGDECQSDYGGRWGKCLCTVGDCVLGISVRLFRRKISPG